MNKQILITGIGKAELIEKPLVTPGPKEVRVRLVRSCISSGTERANVCGVPDNATSIYTDAADDVVTWPRLAGYSSSGIVESIGEGVTSVQVGDRVAMSWTLHSEFITIPEHRVYHIPEGVSLEDAAFTHISTFPMAAIRKCRLEIGEAAMVMGQGVLGQIAIMLLHAAGATPVIAADPILEKRTRALELGADYAFDPTTRDFAQQVKNVSNNDRRVQEGRVTDAGPKVVIEVTGNGQALNTALDAIAPFGRLALLGCTRDSNFTVNYYRKVHGRGITLVGAHTNARPDTESSTGWWSTRDDALAFLRLLQLKRISLNGFTQEVHKPEECPEIYARLARGGAFPIVQFDWTK